MSISVLAGVTTNYHHKLTTDLFTNYSYNHYFLGVGIWSEIIAFEADTIGEQQLKYGCDRGAATEGDAIRQLQLKRTRLGSSS